MTKIREAFDNLLDTIESEVKNKFEKLEEQLREKRLDTLKDDLAELKKREAEKDQSNPVIKQ